MPAEAGIQGGLSLVALDSSLRWNDEASGNQNLSVTDFACVKSSR